MSVKISELTAADSIGSSDVLPIVQSGTTKKVTTSTLLSGKQDTLTAGTNITISSNTINVDGDVIKLPSSSSINLWELDEGVYKISGSTTLYYKSGSSLSLGSQTKALVFIYSSTVTVPLASIKKYLFLSNDTVEYGVASSLVGTHKMLETQSNKVTSISSTSTDTEYPSAKVVYDITNSNYISLNLASNWTATGSTSAYVTIPIVLLSPSNSNYSVDNGIVTFNKAMKVMINVNCSVQGYGSSGMRYLKLVHKIALTSTNNDIFRTIDTMPSSSSTPLILSMAGIILDVAQNDTMRLGYYSASASDVIDANRILVTIIEIH